MNARRESGVGSSEFGANGGRHIMERMRLAPIALVLLLAAPVAAQELTDETFAKIRDHVLPAADELRWTKVDWRASFWDAVVEAQRDDKPILLWAMNGHPLACT